MAWLVRIELPNRARLFLAGESITWIFRRSSTTSPRSGRRRNRRQAKIGYYLCTGAPLAIPLTLVSAISHAEDACDDLGISSWKRDFFFGLSRLPRQT